MKSRERRRPDAGAVHASNEANASAMPPVYLEKYLQKPRHIEIRCSATAARPSSGDAIARYSAHQGLGRSPSRRSMGVAHKNRRDLREAMQR